MKLIELISRSHNFTWKDFIGLACMYIIIKHGLSLSWSFPITCHKGYEAVSVCDFINIITSSPG